MFKHLASLAVALAVGIVATAVSAQPYPNKPIRIVVPYTAGGPADLLVRGLGQQLSDKWGQPVVVDNKPGANEIVAAESVAKAPPDGYTLLVASDAVFTLNSSLYSKLPYDAVKDFTPITRLVTANLLLVTRPDFPASSMKEFIDYAKANPGKLTYGFGRRGWRQSPADGVVGQPARTARWSTCRTRAWCRHCRTSPRVGST